MIKGDVITTSPTLILIDFSGNFLVVCGDVRIYCSYNCCVAILFCNGTCRIAVCVYSVYLYVRSIKECLDYCCVAIECSPV